MPEYLLPDVGEGLTEAEIVTWKVKVGDQVAINDVVVEIETAKSLVELPSPYAGEVTAILVAEGETVPVGTPIIAIGAPDPAAARSGPADGGASAIDLSNPAASGGGEGESLVGRMKADRGPQRRARRPLVDAAGERFARAGVHDVFNQGVTDQQGKVEHLVSAVMHDAEDQAGAAGEPVAPPAEPAPAPAGAAAGDVQVLAKPPVRKLAKDLGVDLRALTGTGRDGTITRSDVEQAAGSPGLETPPPGDAVSTRRPMASSTTGGGERETREPIKGVRKMMASAMTDSAFTAPHVTEWVTIDATATLDLVARLKERREFKGVKVSPLLVFARAVMLAMRRTPMINSTWDEAAGEVVVKHYVNLGIAAATPRGLVVPNVKDADALDLVDLARALEELTATAREGRTQPADMAGGTFTITNVGVFGVDAGTPIINPGESAILCMGAIKPKPWVVGDQVVPRQVTTLALSFDHRHIDGATGSQFLADVAGIVADPATALLF
ncbi:dihydrolipoamide acetyltransferase family protein [Nocardioides bizhenqiangii]|uniref:Dihydrolipoamide acetyltransferase component of pyruvate dehydrogenase complex n=1 Tax=Nocardioides bizhenqiangii TaxID=3095076 RepID=A0ABZ0ZPF7_9ACTN|nr:dihydrolipoamide acetyltransferase family protein [Nocardioides sp. HM61]WQQ26199.1 dihydrolipoamide acetyltransferase family protein [Nocardioides sp. HM61]